MTIKNGKQQESEYLEWIINELSNEDIENIDNYINSQEDTVNKFLKSEFSKTKNKKKEPQNTTNIKNKWSKVNNDEARMREYLEFYDNTGWDKNQKNYNKKTEEYKKMDLHYRICRYEIFLILLFICLIYTSVQYELNFRINLSRLLWMWILSWFSTKMHIPEMIFSSRKGALWTILFIFDTIEHISEFKKHIFFDIYFILTVMAMCYIGWISWRWDYITMWLILLTPIWYFIWLFIKRAYNKLKWYNKK